MGAYPINLSSLQDRLCIVVGGGQVAERKVRSLLEAGALVRVISPVLTAGLQVLASQGAIEYLARAYRESDLEGAFLAFAATNDPAVNNIVGREAKARRVLVDVVDDPEMCSFTVPAVVRRGALTVSVSTGGRSPALAAHICGELENAFGPEYAALTDLLGELRGVVMETCPPARRRQLWHSLIRSDLLELLRDGQAQNARDEARSLIQKHIASHHEGQD